MLVPQAIPVLHTLMSSISSMNQTDFHKPFKGANIEVERNSFYGAALKYIR